MTPAKTDGNDDVKRLLILLLYKLGSSSEEIGVALGVDSSVVRRLVPSRGIKRLVSDDE